LGLTFVDVSGIEKCLGQQEEDAAQTDQTENALVNELLGKDNQDVDKKASDKNDFSKTETPQPDNMKTYSLVSRRTTGTVDKVEVTLEAVGDVTQFLKGKESDSNKMEILAGFRYEERTEKFDEALNSPLQSVRHYNVAKARIQIGNQLNSPVLDTNKKIIICNINGGQSSLFATAGPLKDNQLLLIEDMPANTLLLDRLLPPKKVSVGETWKISDETLGPLLTLDAIDTQNVEASLAEVKNNIALVDVKGDIEGAYLGAASAMDVHIMYQFDMENRRIIWLGLVITESRSLGNIGPAVDLIAKLSLKVQPDIEPEQLMPDNKINVPEEPTKENLQLLYDSPDKGAWRFLHNRNWYIVYDEPGSTKLRLLQNGELLSQCDVAQMGKIDTASPSTLDSFRADLKTGLGNNFGKVISEQEGKTKKDYSELRIVVSNNSESMPLVWIYYLLTKKDGKQAVIAFVVQSDKQETFGDTDREIVDSFEIK
jgi:hypothetical protein